MDARAYPYTTLQLPAETRMLTVLPGAFDDDLVCSLSVMQIASPGEPYDALSYCWSGSIIPDELPDPETVVQCSVYGMRDGVPFSENYDLAYKNMLDHPVYHSQYVRLGFPLPSGQAVIDGVKVTLSGELYRALKRMRAQQEDKPLRIWVDALCINQGDVVERNQHVRMMGDVYANASQVRVWLGEEIGIETELGYTLDTVWSVMNDLLVTQGMMNRSLDDIQSGFFRTQDHEKIDWEKLAEFLERAWFQRTWVIQEIARAREAVIHIGTFQLPWNFLAGALSLLGRYRLNYHIAEYQGSKAVWMMDTLRSELVEQNLPSCSFPLLVLLEELRGFKSTVASDKIYGILGMVDHPLEVDYNKSPEEIFTDLTISYLNTGSLEILNHCVAVPDKTTTLDLPSWVPDWTQSGFVEPFSRRGLEAHAGGNTRPSFTITDRTLKIKGRLLDTIAAIGTAKQIPPPRLTNTVPVTDPGAPTANPQDLALIDPAERTKQRNLAMYANVVDAFREMLDLAFPDKAPTDTTTEYDAFWRTYVCNRTRTNDVPDPIVGEAFNTFLAHMLRDVPIEEHLHARAAHQVAEHGLPEGEAEEWIARRREAYNILTGSNSKWAHNRRFFRSDGGRFGWAVDGTRVGDVVAVFDGGEFPFVLRETPEAGKYRIVGDCYIHGFMEGEGMADEFAEKERQVCVI